MTLFYVLLLLAGVICFFASAFAKRPNGVDLVALGLGLVFLVPLIQFFQKV